MANEAHVKILAQGVTVWNQWRLEHTDIKPNLKGAILKQKDLSGANLAGADLSEAHLEGANLSTAILVGANLRGAHLCGLHVEGEKLMEITLKRSGPPGGMNITWTDLTKADLSEADLTRADVSGADLRQTKLSGAHLDLVNLTWANLETAWLDNATLKKADIFEAYLSDANLSHANLSHANLEGSKIERTILRGSDLSGANLCRASLVGADVSDALLNGCHIHGISAWNLQGEPKAQLDLIITRSFYPFNEPILTVDNLEIAQFIYLLLNNEKIRNVIDTITSRAILILGRFTPPERKAVLETVRDALRERGYVPIMFDFTPSESRDLSETVQLLASLAKFVIADLTDAKSIPQELSHIVPNLPSVPIQPILLASQNEYAMFEHWRRYSWVLHEFLYQDQADLIADLDDKVILPAEVWHQRKSSGSELEEAKRKIEELERLLAAKPSNLQ